MSRPEGTGLSEHERQVLDEIASTLSDEDRSFARRLSAGRRVLLSSGALPPWATPPWSTALLVVVAAVGIVGGTVVVLAALTWSLAVATVGALVVGLGIAAAETAVQRVVRGRRSVRRATG